MNLHGNPSEEEQKDWEAKYAAGPTGLLLYHPQGEQPMSPKQLITEMLNDVLGALIAAYLLSKTAAAFGGRVLFVTLLGLFSWVVISIPYWNWFGFPTDFIAAEGIDQVVGWFLAGLVLAAIVKPART